MFVINHKKLFIGISIGLVAVSIALMAIFGLKLGIDFKGGSLMEVSYPDGIRPNVETATEALKPLNLEGTLIQPTGADGLIIKTRSLSEQERIALLEALPIGGKMHPIQKTFTSIGPSVGKELRRKMTAALIGVVAMIIIFIAFSFRSVSRPVKSWKYGVIAVITLLHDIMIPTGVFAVVAHYRGTEIDTLFVVALLTVLGLSVSDTIVVFDRIRENLKLNRENHSKEEFSETVGHSITQTFTRSINTSLTVILVLLSLFFFGPDSTKTFSLMLAAGMFFGTYSSIFLASPLLVVWEQLQKRKN